MPDNVILIAKAKAKPDNIDQVKEELLAMIEPTRAEQGCLQYNLHQSPEDPTSFMFYEIWESQDALDKHIQTEHLQGLLKKSEDLFDGPLNVTSWQMIS